MQMKIEKLGMKKPIKIKQNVHNQKLMSRAQLSLLKLQDDHSDDMTPLEAIQNNLNLIDELEKFLKEFMKLTPKQLEDVEENLEPYELGEVVGEIAMRFNGATDEEVKEAFEESEQETEEVKADPLKDASDSEKSD